MFRLFVQNIMIKCITAKPNTAYEDLIGSVWIDGNNKFDHDKPLMKEMYDSIQKKAKDSKRTFLEHIKYAYRLLFAYTNEGSAYSFQKAKTKLAQPKRWWDFNYHKDGREDAKWWYVNSF